MWLPDPRMVDELMADEKIRDGLADELEDTRSLAESYAKSIMPRKGVSRQVEVVSDAEGVYLTNLHHGGHLDEWGSKNNPPNAPLRRAADGTGLRFEESPKP